MSGVVPEFVLFVWSRPAVGAGSRVHSNTTALPGRRNPRGAAARPRMGPPGPRPRRAELSKYGKNTLADSALEHGGEVPETPDQNAAALL